jgi:hypothetical protein
MATEAAWLEREDPCVGKKKEKYPGGKQKEKTILDSYRPSHGRTLKRGALLESFFRRLYTTSYEEDESVPVSISVAAKRDYTGQRRESSQLLEAR